MALFYAKTNEGPAVLNTDGLRAVIPLGDEGDRIRLEWLDGRYLNTNTYDLDGFVQVVLGGDTAVLNYEEYGHD